MIAELITRRRGERGTACVQAMKSALAVALMALVAPSVLAGSLTVDPSALSADEWGVYTAEKIETVLEPSNSSGKREKSRNETLLLLTHDICAALGTYFGFRYHLTGAVPVASLRVNIRITHPPLPSWRGGTQTEDTFDDSVEEGQSRFAGWVFRDPRKLVDGEWHFTVMSQGRALLEQDFRIRTACAPAIS